MHRIFINCHALLIRHSPKKCDLQAMVISHFNVSGLAELYGVHAASELVNIYFDIVSNPLSTAELQAHLREQASNHRRVVRNSWQAALYQALAQFDWFCGGGYNHVAHTFLPSRSRIYPLAHALGELRNASLPFCAAGHGLFWDHRLAPCQAITGASALDCSHKNLDFPSHFCVQLPGILCRDGWIGATCHPEAITWAGPKSALSNTCLRVVTGQDSRAMPAKVYIQIPPVTAEGNHTIGPGADHWAKHQTQITKIYR
ncbi:hypothetical protein VM94_02210 [Janthinobacterium sp. KBS0711]|uniref:hypothetical protein n=1 Tax=Janthinobacterium sp. KBS0711 TaxID=1649647 RepID=UPI000638C4CB|nr:hypothetical protein [Janthinobacterium sp. KBS0711]KKO64068.1 hypothetical protein VM94_02210 [Janthinobacterium sp. KBS0711]TSD72240.1 hypothetical protein FFI39_015385 [Janthinobacterium sp. KBS0711]